MMKRQKQAEQILREYQTDAVLAALPANIRYLSGFVGSESYLYFSEKQQVILTDSRYTLQAEQEAEGCSVRTISNGRGYAVLLEELLEDEHQKLLFVFDYMTERAFFMELREIIPGKDLDKAVCSKSIGEAPVQIMSFDEMDAKTGNTEIGEDFYGDSEYDIDELDKEGFDGLGDGPMDNPYDDERF